MRSHAVEKPYTRLFYKIALFISKNTPFLESFPTALAVILLGMKEIVARDQEATVCAQLFLRTHRYSRLH